MKDFVEIQDRLIKLSDIVEVEKTSEDTIVIIYNERKYNDCIDYLKARDKDYPCAQYCNTRTVLDYNEFSEFIKLYMLDFKRIYEIDLKENEEFYESLIKHLDDKDILGYIVGWC